MRSVKFHKLKGGYGWFRGLHFSFVGEKESRDPNVRSVLDTTCSQVGFDDSERTKASTTPVMMTKPPRNVEAGGTSFRNT